MQIDDRLKNWSRYYRTRLIYACCGSAEKNYRAPWRQWVALADIQHDSQIDIWDAQKVERAWRSMLGKHKLILKYTYMSPGMPAWVICRKAHVKTWKLVQETERAKKIIKTILDKMEPLSDNCADNLKPCETREDAARWEGRSFSENEPV